MTKYSKRTRRPTTLGVIVAIIIAVIAALQSAQKTNAPAPTATGLITQMFMTATAAPNTPTTAVTLSPGATALPTLASTASSPTRVLPTDLPGLEITPMSGTLYEVTGSVNALGCPDTRCKVINLYKKDNIIVVTGTVMGTTYKTKKTRIWYQVIFHDGSKVYVHGSYVKPHEA